MPKPSAIEFIVDAVPIVLQCPADGALSHARSRNSSSLISPAASLRRERQMTVPEPTSSPSCQPSSIGPPDSTIAGMRSEEHTSELQSLMRTSYAVFCLKKNTKNESTQS